MQTPSGHCVVKFAGLDDPVDTRLVEHTTMILSNLAGLMWPIPLLFLLRGDMASSDTHLPSNVLTVWGHTGYIVNRQRRSFVPHARL